MSIRNRVLIKDRANATVHKTYEVRAYLEDLSSIEIVRGDGKCSKGDGKVGTHYRRTVAL